MNTSHVVVFKYRGSYQKSGIEGNKAKVKVLLPILDTLKIELRNTSISVVAN